MENHEESPEVLKSVLRLSNSCVCKYREVPSLSIAKQAIDLIILIINQYPWTKASELVTHIKQLYKKHHNQFCQYEDIVCNIFKRTLKLIREECARISDQVETADLPLSLMELLLPEGYCNLLNISREHLEDDIIDAIDEISTELENSTDELLKNASEIIHEDDKIMTFGFSPTLIKMFKQSAKSYNFTITYVKNPIKDEMLETFISNLQSEKIRLVVVPYSNLSAMLSLTNKVICSAKSLLSNGSIRGVAGFQMLAELANNRKIPVIVVAGTHKLWDKDPPFSYSMNEFRHRIDGSLIMENPRIYSDNQIVLRYAFDYVPCCNINLIISNLGRFAPSKLYSISNDLYSTEDNDI